MGDNTTNLWLGHTKGEGGLYLTLWNALDESWQQEYSEAVNDWNTRCDPKVLVLTSKDVAVDNECTQADGVMKVCNGTLRYVCVFCLCVIMIPVIYFWVCVYVQRHFVSWS